MSRPEFAVIGLGTMGAALALNMADKGFDVAVHNRSAARIDALVENAGDLADRLTPAKTLDDLVAAMKGPRAILLMVPAGQPVDDQIAALLPLLDEGDLIIDGGNSGFHDSERRAAAVEALGKRFIGLGVSGGEDGARHGPSLMAGGSEEAWERAAPVLTAIAATYEDEPCAALLGAAGAGHFVKMVHNGIEYADMQMIAEAYGIMRDGMGRTPAAMSDTFSQWNDGPLRSYLIEISAAVLKATDPKTGNPMIDMIVDRAGQKGTGRWTAIEAQELGTPVPVIDAAVTARNVSARLEERQRGADRFGEPARPLPDGAVTDTDLESALIAGKIVCYAQGFAMLADGGADNGWELRLADVARVWRAGCIIRSAMLDDMATALEQAPDTSLLMAPFFADLMERHVPGLRKTVTAANGHGLPVPSLSAALNWFDMMATSRSTANMIQGQRDYFGAHGFERTDEEGTHHGPW
ncbi:NADP-dependent phosphogluconate dehydrogenase [Oceaniradius stylonematis]|uniref:6-phosphogluconate dehydrogenase, decarboxylating n=1 Tax=Oceaniradius stylonematis TaxID=2184161 RepID=A0A3A8ACA8_9HYPH|nr:NADP-dependent phosphogluconate dehydrogenase [Oceaniradius stylonematis]RKF06968.1 NADP-dependent phosphogluconate dehydrogenase [Oceaniradius stylonematis]